MLKVNKPLVSVNWLSKNLDAENLIILDATISIVGIKDLTGSEKRIILKSRFLDIKNTFSKKNAAYPNTILSAEKFQEAARNLGINNDSCIVVYDDVGIYSSPRVWWMFRLMGFSNIAVLNGGLPAWEKAKLPTEKPLNAPYKKGNFLVNFQSKKIKTASDVLLATKTKNSIIADARSSGRFFATEPEPRKEVRGGRIPNSVNLPYKKLQENGKMKSIKELKNSIKKINPNNKELIFSCGSGITACILALSAELINYNNYAVYDGSWTEWGSNLELPIKK